MLPVSEIYGPLRAHFAIQNTAVLIAPPGAGKTTGVPLALLDEAWLEGQTIIMLEPRRLAARAAAHRMAETLGEAVGKTVGYRVRGESAGGKHTRIWVVTEGVFTRQILDDPTLTGVGLVIFDEFHERSLDADMGLAFARECQGLLRDDLRLLVMSATLDGARITEKLDGTALLQSEGRSFPVETRYLGRDQGLHLADDVARHVKRLTAHLTPENPQTFLVFLPGQGEISRVYEALLEANLPPHIELHKLYGALDFAAQKAVLSPLKEGQSRIVLATNIAETSLTLDRVGYVLDCGYFRAARYDPALSQIKMGLERVSKAAADQRRGRAGRTSAGVCYRLWDEAQDRALIPFGRPEILDTDLSQLLLNLKAWGNDDVASLCLLDLPPKAALSEARNLLMALEALDAEGHITEHGKRLHSLPLSPRLGHMLMSAANMGHAETACLLAALLSDQSLGGKPTDMGVRFDNFKKDRSPRAQAAKSMAQTWQKTLPKPLNISPLSLGGMITLAYPERLAKRRGDGGDYLMRNGRGAYLEGHDPLARSEYLAVADLGGGTGKDRILSASPIEISELSRLFADQIKTTTEIKTDGPKVRAFEETQLGALVLKSKPLQNLTPQQRLDAEAATVSARGLKTLKVSERFWELLARLSYAAKDDDTLPPMDEAALIETVCDWLGAYAPDGAILGLDEAVVCEALKGRLTHDQAKAFDKRCPSHFTLPTGNRVRIDYSHENGPRIEARVQELYGQTIHPSVGAHQTPLTLVLLSPAHRPIQITKDLPAFWRGSWAEVRTEMKGRYPRHVWPEDPTKAEATSRAKPRGT